MRLAVFSDIHGNYELLDKTLKVIDGQSVDMTLCLGDILGKGPESLRCLRLIRDRNIKCLQGNWEMYINRGFERYDEFTNHHDFYENLLAELTLEEKNWINNLPFEYVVKCNGYKLLFMHFPIEDINRQYPFYFLSTLRNGSIFEILKEYDYDLMVYGHAHVKQQKDKVMLVPSTLSEFYSYLIIEIDDKGIRYEWSDISNV